MNHFPVLNPVPADLTGLPVVKVKLPEPTGCPFKDRPEYRQYAVICAEGNQVTAYFSSLKDARDWVKSRPKYAHARIYRRLKP